MPRLLSLRAKSALDTQIRVHQSNIPSVDIEYCKWALLWLILHHHHLFIVADGHKLSLNPGKTALQGIINKLERHSKKLAEDELR